MKIREGAYYRTRGGYVVGPMEKTDHGNYPWSSLHDCWTDDGRFNIADDECEADLISEVYVSDTPPVLADIRFGGGGGEAPAPEVETLRDRFAIAALSALTGLMVNLKIEMPHDELADKVYRMADAMMEARKK